MERLPSEILSRIVRMISNDHNKALSTKTIHALRLVSHRTKSIATAFLIQSVTVGLSTESFLKFEELCRHPEFRLSIRHVRINASFYDVQMAKDRGYFCQHCGTEFFQVLEMYERTSRRSDAVDKKLNKMWRVANEIQHIRGQEFDETSVTPAQRIIMNFHQDYQKLTADQEELRQDNDHLRRLCEALARLPALETIRLDDGIIGRRGIMKTLADGKISSDDPRNLSFAIERSMWKGSFQTAYRAQQPFEMLGELLARLGRSNIRPRSIRVDFSVPTDLCKFQISEEQAHGIHDLVSKARDISMTFGHWARKGSLAENNDRSVGEMTALGSITQALTTTSTLETLHLGLPSYPVFYQFPTVSAHALLPLHTTEWPALYDLHLRHVPTDMADLVLLTRSHRDTLTSLKMQSPFLRTGDWDEAVEHLAALKRLDHVDISYPKGGRYGDRYDHGNQFPAADASRYILGQSHENPVKVVVAELAAP